MAVLKKFSFGSSFLEWIEAVLKNQQSCVINAGTTSPYFKLGDPISAYLFILALEILFYMIKTNQNVEGLDICDYSFLYSAHADDTTFFLKNMKSVRELLDMIDYFSNYSRLYSNISKCETFDVGTLKGVHMTACVLKSVDLISDTLKY